MAVFVFGPHDNYYKGNSIIESSPVGGRIFWSKSKVQLQQFGYTMLLTSQLTMCQMITSRIELTGLELLVNFLYDSISVLSV